MPDIVTSKLNSANSSDCIFMNGKNGEKCEGCCVKRSHTTRGFGCTMHKKATGVITFSGVRRQ